ncbi:MAG: leucine-rich repeat domain-containing protein [Ruminococcaceae bacterium]|nr:leucine-rich repeat domain-containing protein [Oscillospiraceae bacterium]
MKTSKILVLMAVLFALTALLCLSSCEGEKIDMSTPSEGLKFEANSDGTYYVSGIGACTDEVIVIPETTATGKSITGIGYRAFADNSKIKAVAIPSSVKTIGNEAFDNCDELTVVEIANGTQTIEEEAFAHCEKIKKVELPDSVKKIGKGAFWLCKGLESVSIPDGLEELGNYAFSSCHSLKMEKYNGAYYIGSSYNPYLILLKAVNQDIDFCQINDSTKFVHSEAFEECGKLTSITIPSGVVKIGGGAFYRCSSLSAVEFVITDGWTCYDFHATGDIKNVSKESMADADDAARYLTNMLLPKYLTRE